MSVPSLILDGIMPYGTGTPLTINGITYAIESENITDNWTEAEDFTAEGKPNRLRLTKQRYTGSYTVQLATGSTQYPAQGQTFQRTPPNEASPVTFIVTGVPYTATNSAGDIRTCTFNVKQAIGNVTTVA